MPFYSYTKPPSGIITFLHIHIITSEFGSVASLRNFLVNLAQLGEV